MTSLGLDLSWKASRPSGLSWERNSLLHVHYFIINHLYLPCNQGSKFWLPSTWVNSVSWSELDRFNGTITQDYIVCHKTCRRGFTCGWSGISQILCAILAAAVIRSCAALSELITFDLRSIRTHEAVSHKEAIHFHCFPSYGQTHPPDTKLIAKDDSFLKLQSHYNQR